MRNLLPLFVLALTLSISYSNMTMAVCVENPAGTFTCNTNAPNPDPTGVQEGSATDPVTVNVVPGGAIDTVVANGGNDGVGIGTGGSPDTVTLTSAEVSGQDAGISTGNEEDIVNVTDSKVSGLDNDTIRTGNDDDTVTVIDSMIRNEDPDGNSGIASGNDNDTIIVRGSTIFSENGRGISGGNDNDHITISDTFIDALEEGVGLGNNDDILRIETGVRLESMDDSNIDCGSGFDTIEFAIEVPEDMLNRFSLEILRADPAGDSIEINGLTYEWEDCELLVNELVGVPIEPRPIPTLSQWGMIALAATMGLFGAFYAIRRRTAADA